MAQTKKYQPINSICYIIWDEDQKHWKCKISKSAPNQGKVHLSNISRPTKVSISLISPLLTGAGSDNKLAELVLVPFDVFTNFGSSLNGNGSDDDAEGFSSSWKISIEKQPLHVKEILQTFSSMNPWEIPNKLLQKNKVVWQKPKVTVIVAVSQFSERHETRL